jgi:hypothetical protein
MFVSDSFLSRECKCVREEIMDALACTKDILVDYFLKKCKTYRKMDL